MPVNLAELDGIYNETKAATDGLPVGTYQCRIDEAHMKPTKDEKYWMLALTLKVLAGPHSGQKAFMNIVIKGDEQNLKFVKRDLFKLGYSGPLSQLESVLDTFVDLCVEIQVKLRVDKNTKEENLNTYLQKRIEPSQIPPGYEGPEPNFAPPPVEAATNDF
jgi:hypothetical protein